MQSYAIIILGDKNMINKLLDTIKNYIYYLINEGLYISIHTDLAEYMIPLLEFNIHRNPICTLSKSENEEWDKCIEIHTKDSFSTNAAFKKRICPKGVEEYVFKLYDSGSVCVSFDRKLSEKFTEEKLKSLINPLCAMMQYLVFLCPKTENEISDNELVNRFIKYIQRNFYNPIKNEDIAKSCSCSVSTLCHLFKQYTGESVHSYILNLRLHYAKELLKTSNLSITAISAKSGFSDYSYFSAYFRKVIGISPSEFRKSISK